MLGFLTGKNKKVQQYLNEGGIIVDVRSKTEYEEGHLRNSTNIPLDSLPKFIGQLDKSKPIVTCCASGMRSGSAKRMLKANGFSVVNGGGWMNLQKYE
ncbi:rhodanese-like domain-containing protein [Ekhidna sp.]